MTDPRFTVDVPQDRREILRVMCGAPIPPIVLMGLGRWLPWRGPVAVWCERKRCRPGRESRMICMAIIGEQAMPSLVGVWKLVEARAFDGSGQELPPPLGPQPMGLAYFEAERMVGIIGDARPSVPAEGPMRPFLAYMGNYSFDGETLVTKADDASRPALIVEQVRTVRFDGPDRMTVTPTSGVPGYNGIHVTWERIG